jgi:phage tail-like protein
MTDTPYMLTAYNYRVTILNGNSGESVSFSEVSGLSVQYEPVTYKHGMSFLLGHKIIPGMVQPINVTLKRGVAKNKTALMDWFTTANTDPFSMSKKRDVVIDLCDSQGMAVIRWTVQRALPVKLEMGTLDANSNEVAIMTLELVAHGLQIAHLDAAS